MAHMMPNHIKMDIRETRWGDVDWIDLAKG
jgi:hypothetical protein